MREVTEEEFDRSPREFIELSRHEAIYVKDGQRTVRVLGMEPDAGLPADVVDEGLIMDHKAPTMLPVGAMSAGWLA